MAFGANAGPSAAPFQTSAIIPGPDATASAYDADENLEYETAGGSHVKGGSSERISTVVYSFAAALDKYTDATDDGSAADTGVLVSAVAIANQHGIPANFGPGRGNWKKEDNHRISVELVKQYSGIVPGGSVEVLSLEIDGVAPGNIVIILKNLSTIDLSFLDIRVKYDHSLTY